METSDVIDVSSYVEVSMEKEELDKPLVNYGEDYLDKSVLEDMGLQDESNLNGIDPKLDAILDDEPRDFMICYRCTLVSNSSMFGIGQASDKGEDIHVSCEPDNCDGIIDEELDAILDDALMDIIYMRDVEAKKVSISLEEQFVVKLCFGCWI